MTQIVKQSVQLVDGKWQILHTDVVESNLSRRYIQDTMIWIPYPDVGYMASFGNDDDGWDFYYDHIRRFKEAYDV